MTEKNILLLNAAFSSYRTYISLLEKTIPAGNMHRIFVNRVKLEDGQTVVSISIKNTKYDRNHDEKVMFDKFNNRYFNYEINVPLPDNLAKELIDIIIYDFTENHFINYTSFNSINKFVTFQNCRFSLCIHLDDELEMKKVKEIHDNIGYNNNSKNRVRKISK